MSVVAVIPARGGSKGIPGKNLRTVDGLPLVARAVESALACEYIDAVYVSTDDPAIAAAARMTGAEVIERPAELATDTATSESALIHALDAMRFEPDVLVFLQATSPFIDPDDLDDAIGRVLDGPEDVVFAAVETFAFLWTIDGEGVNHDPSTRPRRQDREPHYRETGAFYVLRTDGFRAARHRFFGIVGLAIVDELTSIEIDTETELALAESIARSLGSRTENDDNKEEPWLFSSEATR
jgi:CMP-N-acetylneuraminic acid synthetase